MPSEASNNTVHHPFSNRLRPALLYHRRAHIELVYVAFNPEYCFHSPSSGTYGTQAHKVHFLAFIFVCALTLLYFGIFDSYILLAI